jgi:uncharacterized protein (DUF1684 family)
MIPSVTRLLVLLTLVAGCVEEWPEVPPVELDAFRSEHEAWRQNREERLVTPPGGSVLWVGLFELPQGATPFGSDPHLPITLPAEDAPPLAGTLYRSGQEVRLEPSEGSPVSLRGEEEPLGPMVLGSDRSGSTTNLALGSLGMRIHGEPGTDRLWLRVWDEDMAARDTFRLPEYYPVDPDWHVRAWFEPYPEAEPLRVPDVTGGMIEYQARGELIFQRDGRDHSLIATAGDNASSFFIMMWDSTATVDTYQGGRYLRADLPDETGWTTIDFNRAYNAPCVFTAFSVCALPPRGNWLELPVTAGEKRPEKPVY